MAKAKAKANAEEVRTLNTWWVRAILAIILLGLSYGFLSLAIDSGSLLEYAVGIIFLIWAIRSIVRAIKTR